MNIKTVLIFAALTLLWGCAGGPQYTVSPEWDKSKLAKVFIYRTNVSFHSLNPEKPFFYIDGQHIGKLGTGQSVDTFVLAGEHTVSVKESILFMPGSESGHVKFKAEPNKEYYIRYSKDFSGIAMAGSTAVATGDSSLQMANKEFYLEKK